MLKRSLVALAIAAAMPLSAQAADFDYNYFEAGYSQQDSGYGNSRGNGYTIAGSVGFAENFYVSADYRDTGESYEWSGGYYNYDYDYKFWNVNFGYHRSLNENNDLIAEVGYGSWEEDYEYFYNYTTPWFSGHNEDEGARFAIGLRTAIGDKWETVAKLGRQAGGDDYFEGYTTAELGVMYKINPTWGVRLDTKMVNDWETHYTLAVRASFGGGSKSSSSSSSSSDSDHEFSYSFIQVGAEAVDWGGGSDWESGYSVRGSVGFAEKFYVRASYADYNSMDDKRYDLGFGFHNELTPSNDFVADISYGGYDYGCTGSCTDEGFNVSAGIRTSITDRLEASAMLGYNTGGDNIFDDLTTAKLGLSYNISGNFDAVFDAELVNDWGTFYTFGVRANF